MSSGEEEKELRAAINTEMQQFEQYYRWLENHMPPPIFKEIDSNDLMLIAHALMGFPLQEFKTRIDLPDRAIAMRLDSPDADMKILKNYRYYGVKKYRAFVSDVPPPISGVRTPLRIGVIIFSDLGEEKLTKKQREEIQTIARENQLEIPEDEINHLIAGINTRFLLSLTKERLVSALNVYHRATSRDLCQYEVKYNEDWEDNREVPSLQIVMAWRNVPRRHFLYRVAKTIYRHGLDMQKVNASYIHPYSPDSVLIMSLGLHGQDGKAAWEEADINDLIRELVTLKYFEGHKEMERTFVDTKILSANTGNFLKATIDFVHQVLVHIDINMYSIEHVEEAICRHPELTVELCEAFAAKFDPEKCDIEKYKVIKEKYLQSVNSLDTGQEINDIRRRNVLRQAMHFIDFTLKTNFFRENKSSLSFRLDPQFMDNLPYEREDLFPELPYAIFYIKGMYFIGFHIRFKDLSRGGLRTIIPRGMEEMVIERNDVFAECYALAFTQQKKNKEIPEGGAKGVIFLEPYAQLTSEANVYARELKKMGLDEEEIEEKIEEYHKQQRIAYLYQSQRSYIDSFLILINCEPDGTLKAKNIVDYWKQPEYIYLGPDENMHNPMIDWMAEISKRFEYQPGASFISSKPRTGINHKEYGVTSLGINVYMEEVLKYLGIDPIKDPFTIKMSGGPDGDVAGNQIYNLYKYYPNTAKLIALTDGSGTVYDPNGLNLEIMADLFKEGKAIRNYPPKKLSDGGFLLDLQTKKKIDVYTSQTLCWRKVKGKLKEDWLSGSEMNHLHRSNVHEVKSDIFIPGGGRPRTLNESSYQEFLDENGQPTSRAIVEGANLYLTPLARRNLENLGTLVIKDSSANKGGVICSSLEVLIGLTTPEEEFLEQKAKFMEEVLQVIRDRARDEALLMLKIHKETGSFLSEISEWVSERINTYTYEILDYLQTVSLSNDPKDPLIRCLLNYCLPMLRANYQENILKIPDIHKKAIISCYLASRVVYTKGLDWNPSIVDVLPLIANDPEVIDLE